MLLFFSAASRIDGQSCEAFYAGDTADTSNLFAVGSTDHCSEASTFTPIVGSADCYSSDTSGGYVTFSTFRLFNAEGHISRGHNGQPWSVYLRGPSACGAGFYLNDDVCTFPSSSREPPTCTVCPTNFYKAGQYFLIDSDRLTNKLQQI